MKKFKKILGVFTGIGCITYTSMIFTEKEKTLFIFMAILFGFFTFLLLRPKKKDTSNQHIMSNSNLHSITSTDTASIPQQQQVQADFTTSTNPTYNRIITDDEVPALIQAGYEKVMKMQEQSNNPKFHRTEYEEELSFEFIQKYSKKVALLTKDFEMLYRKAFEVQDPTQQINLLHEALTAFNNAKNFCYSKGKGGTIYFQDTWEYLDNSRNPCFSYEDMITKSLNEILFEQNTMIPNILQIISKNNGILQKNIYQYMPNIEKDKIRNEIKKLESQNKIYRIKKSNSYELYICK